MSSITQLHPVSTQGAAAAVRHALNFPHTDVGNAALFVQLHKDFVRYATDTKCWYVYRTGYWAPDAEAEVQELAKGITSYLSAAAASISGGKDLKAWAKKSGEARKVSAIVKLASSDPAITCKHDEFDCDPMVLGVGNGVVDLRTGTFRPAQPGDMLVVRAPVDYVAGADCPLFKRFLLEVCCGDTKLVAFKLRMLAYCLTGDTREQKWFFFHGEHGSNGKSTLLQVLTMLLGNELVVTVPSGFFTEKAGKYNGSPESYVMSRLSRARIAVSPELGDNERLNEELMKMMTGRDHVPARDPGGKPFTFLPRFKILQLGNDVPNIYGTGDAIWRRTVLVHFNALFANPGESNYKPGAKPKDDQLLEKLRLELPGILNLLIRSCVRWQRNGLLTPQVVREKIAENRVEQDTFGEWLSDPDEVELAPEYKTKASELHNAYSRWARRSGYPVMSVKSLKKQMLSRKFQHVKDKHGHWYLSVKPVADDPFRRPEFVTLINLPAPSAVAPSPATGPNYERAEKQVKQLMSEELPRGTA